MTKAVRNSASETMTALGGAVAVPSAVRNSDSTTTMRVNDVIMTRIDGASDNTVNSATSWITRSVRPLPCPKLTLMSCADAVAVSPARIPATPHRHRHQTDTAVGSACHDFPGGRPNKLAISSSRILVEVLAGRRRWLGAILGFEIDFGSGFEFEFRLDACAEFALRRACGESAPLPGWQPTGR